MQRIYAYSVRQFGRDQVLSYVESGCLDMLAALPGLGRSAAKLRRGYCRFEHGSHVIFYIEIHHGIRVIRILHERMDPKRYL